MRIYKNGIYRDMTPGEIATLQTEQRKAELLEKSRFLSTEEVNRLFIMQNINYSQ